jgi:hypothetical protein
MNFEVRGQMQLTMVAKIKSFKTSNIRVSACNKPGEERKKHEIIP